MKKQVLSKKKTAKIGDIEKLKQILGHYNFSRNLLSKPKVGCLTVDAKKPE